MTRSLTTRSSRSPRSRRLLLGVAASTLALLASACSLVGSGGSEATDGAAGSGGSGSGSASGAPSQGDGSVVLVTHDSFSLPGSVIRSFEQQSGYDLVVRSSGDAGILTNKLVLTQGDPDGDVSFGVDNTFGSRALAAGVFAPYTPPGADAVSRYDLPGDTDHALTPVDNGNVCVNVDDSWFAAHHLAPPKTLADLADPRYKNLFVLPGAATSSTGLAFLLTTVAAYGSQWTDYWSRLMANGAKLTQGWSDAYEVDFTAGGGQGDRPIVLSYDSSPAFTTAGGGTRTTTSALLDTCFRQVEYVGVLAGAQDPAGAQAFVRFMLSPAVQKALPESMYVFPDVPGTPLPKEWAQFARQPQKPWSVDPQRIADHRDEWLREWTDVTSR